MLARAGPRGDPLATQSVCLNMMLLKLNSTENVVLFNLTNTSFGMTGCESDL